MFQTLFWHPSHSARAAKCNAESANPVSSAQCRLISAESKLQHQKRLKTVSTGILLKTQTPQALALPLKV